MLYFQHRCLVPHFPPKWTTQIQHVALRICQSHESQTTDECIDSIISSWSFEPCGLWGDRQFYLKDFNHRSEEGCRELRTVVTSRNTLDKLIPCFAPKNIQMIAFDEDYLQGETKMCDIWQRARDTMHPCQPQSHISMVKQWHATKRFVKEETDPSRATKHFKCTRHVVKKHVVCNVLRIVQEARVDNQLFACFLNNMIVAPNQCSSFLVRRKIRFLAPNHSLHYRNAMEI